MALFALALQLALSFGHVHGIATAHASQVTAIADSGERASAPQPDTGDHGDDYCAICAVLTLLTGAQTAAPPVFTPPAVIASAEIVVTEEAPLLDSQRSAFRSRAPPQT